ncbi:MAG: hypothetical protein H8E79_04990, partial [Desulfobulbaceae bacterium]|nr:hypothetical protein [Candidatus Desulfatifera sulfidica]
MSGEECAVKTKVLGAVMDRTVEDQAVGAELEGEFREEWSWFPVSGITDQWVSCIGLVTTDLVGSACMDADV